MREEYIKKILEKLQERYPQSKITLNYTNWYELLIATILAAQCTDKRVNIVTEKLFVKYKTLKDYGDADLKELEKDIYSTGFYRNKAKNIKHLANKLIKKDKIPQSMDELIKLPGIGRKTANVFLSNYLNKNEGVIVDTHMIRISNLLKLVHSKNPSIIEKKLNNIIPKKDYLLFSNLIISLGRDTCIAKKPKCNICILQNICPSANIKNPTKIEGEKSSVG